MGEVADRHAPSDLGEAGDQAAVVSIAARNCGPRMCSA